MSDDTMTDPMLARVVQMVNDSICTHRDGDDLLCPECSVKVLDLAHRTVGTALDLPDTERARVYVRLALDEAESVAWGDEDPRVTRGREVVAAWLDGDGSIDLADAADAADAAARTAARAARATAFAAADATDASRAARATAFAAADATSFAADAATRAADRAAVHAADAADAAALAAGNRLARAHALIDRFEALTGVKASAPDTKRVMTDDMTDQEKAAAYRAAADWLETSGTDFFISTRLRAEANRLDPPIEDGWWMPIEEGWWITSLEGAPSPTVAQRKSGKWYRRGGEVSDFQDAWTPLTRLTDDQVADLRDAGVITG